MANTYIQHLTCQCPARESGRKAVTLFGNQFPGEVRKLRAPERYPCSLIRLFLLPLSMTLGPD